MKKLLVLLQHTLTLSILLWFVVPRPAHAYLDPNIGSSIIQIVIAGLATASYLVKVFWKQISAFFGKLFGKKQPVEKTKDAPKEAAKKSAKKDK